MKRTFVLLIVGLLGMGIVSPVLALPVEIYSEDRPVQDPLIAQGWYHELGDGFDAFYVNEQIATTDTVTGYIPCPSEYNSGAPPILK